MNVSLACFLLSSSCLPFQLGVSMKWIGHRYFTLVVTNCWCLAKSAHEIGWDYHDPSPVCNKEYCQVLYEASVEPDDKELWSKC